MRVGVVWESCTNFGAPSWDKSRPENVFHYDMTRYGGNQSIDLTSDRTPTIYHFYRRVPTNNKRHKTMRLLLLLLLLYRRSRRKRSGERVRLLYKT